MVTYPDFDFLDVADNDVEVPIQEQVLIMHYMSSMKSIEPAGKWIAYREIWGHPFSFLHL